MMTVATFVCRDETTGLWRYWVYNEYNAVLDEGVAKTQYMAQRKADHSKFSIEEVLG